MLLASQQDAVEQQQIKEQEELTETFKGFLQFVENETPETEPTVDQTEVFYLWDTKLPIFSIFKVLRHYFIEDCRFDSALLLELVKQKQLDLEEALLDLSFIRQGFVSKLPKGT